MQIIGGRVEKAPLDKTPEETAGPLMRLQASPPLAVTPATAHEVFRLVLVGEG